MNLAVESKPMPKRPGRPKRSLRNDVAVKVDSGVVTKAKLVADTRDITLAEYLTELLRVPVDRDFAKAVRSIEKPESKE
jgi:hypothetical protein